MSSVLTTLRDIVPLRALTVPEALRIAELRSIKLLELSGISEPPVPEQIITELPRMQVERVKLTGLSGATQWSHGRWLIVIHGREIPTRQRFSLAHDFKHVIDNRFIGVLYPPTHGQTRREREEQVCHFFAECLLMPRTWLKRAWGSGQQDVRKLAATFDVSQMAMRVRLMQTGLDHLATARDPIGAPAHEEQS